MGQDAGEQHPSSIASLNVYAILGNEMVGMTAHTSTSMLVGSSGW